MRLTSFFLFLALLVNGCSSPLPAQAPPPLHIIPQPVSISAEEGTFKLDSSTLVYFPAGKPQWELPAKYWMGIVLQATGWTPQSIPYSSREPSVPRSNSIYLIEDASVEHPEGYVLEVRSGWIALRAQNAAGAFYGIQTLRQLFPASINRSDRTPGQALLAQCCKIKDQPRFPYRGMHLDVARHFFPVSFVKKYIDLLAQHKMNTFHWHLTEDQGWRIEIKSLPRLQSVAACREKTLKGHYNDQPWQFEPGPYCGYYTQEEIKEVVAYAQERFVTIIPEIELPGHSTAALAAYPNLGCTGGPYKPLPVWGISDDVYCAGNDSTFLFLEKVLTEVCALFPGPYVHIGGDECPKTRWRNCNKCQQRMREEGLADEHELQSWFIRQASGMLDANGKKLIGWDEILEGGLAPDATVMSWRGTKGGIAAAKAGHDVIMTPNSHCYFDHYQGDPEVEPLAIGGFTTLEKVYSYEPVPEGLRPEEAKRILGAQSNLWTEYIPTSEKAEYMAYPRACALAEVVWSNPAYRNWPSFVRRLKTHLPRLEAQDVHYSNTLYEVNARYYKGQVYLSTADSTLDIRYTDDGSTPGNQSRRYKGPFEIKKSSTLKMQAFAGDKPIGRVRTVSYLIHKASGKPYTMSGKPGQYDGGETYALTNGVVGSIRSWNKWVGLVNQDIDPAIDLGEATDVQSVSMQFVDAKASWIWPPKSVELAVSDDGVNFRTIKTEVIELGGEQSNNVLQVNFSDLNINTRYLRVTARTFGKIPDGHQGEGNGAWLFMDEVVVY